MRLSSMAVLASFAMSWPMAFSLADPGRLIADPVAGTRTKQDPRGCGWRGCVQNPDGTYSPGKDAPVYVDSVDDSGPVRSVVDEDPADALDKYSPGGCKLGCVYDAEKNVWHPIKRQRVAKSQGPTDATAPGHQSKNCQYSGNRVVPIKGIVTCVAFMKCDGESGPGLCNIKGNGCPQDANACANDQDRQVGKDTMDEAGIFKALCMDPKTQATQQGCKPAGKRGDSGFVGEPDTGRDSAQPATPAAGISNGIGNGSATKGD